MVSGAATNVLYHNLQTASIWVRLPLEPQRSDLVFHAAPPLQGKTVAAGLRDWLGGQSWSDVRQLVRSRRVQVNGNLCTDAERRLAEGDVVKVLAHSAPKPPSERDVRLQYLDQHLLVVEKPAGITSTRHAEERNWPTRRRQLRPTLEEMLPLIVAKVDPNMRRQRGVPPPVRAVHRLDRETSGLMVFARTVSAESELMRQFKRHSTHRRYLAVARGRVEAQTIDTFLARDRGDGRRGSTSNPNVGKRAVTHVRPLEIFEPGGDRHDLYTLVECRLETGRTHQIRIHLAERGHPLCGERVYQQPLFGKPLEDISGAPRNALHAAELGFVHPISGEEMRFEMPLPRDLKQFIERLRGAIENRQ
jgi:23S rRNA pseudouridine1911/1915/1917 synthase